MAIARGEPGQAERDALEALAIAASTGAYLGAPDTLECLAAFAVDAGSHREAARRYGAANAIRQRIGVVRFKIYDAGYETSVAALRESPAEHSRTRLGHLHRSSGSGCPMPVGQPEDRQSHADERGSSHVLDGGEAALCELDLVRQDVDDREDQRREPDEHPQLTEFAVPADVTIASPGLCRHVAPIVVGSGVHAGTEFGLRERGRLRL